MNIVFYKTWFLFYFIFNFDNWANTELLSQDMCKFDYNLSNKHYCFAKRGFDIFGSLILLILFSPLFILISILIKLSSRGPVFFCHCRVGLGGKQFYLWKFRSMVSGVSKYEFSPKNVADMRITFIGRFIRRLSIDEIPQLINVLRGEMSLVGPRPEMPFIVESYGSLEQKRLNIKPGITGLWQISPARAFPIHSNLQYDFYYIRHQSLFLDFAILLRTVAAVIRSTGAI
jgi:lipopolysaccharide/colanic/teichoic acid biosynthesis glycosyltransferase